MKFLLEVFFQVFFFFNFNVGFHFFFIIIILIHLAKHLEEFNCMYVPANHTELDCVLMPTIKTRALWETLSVTYE